MRILVLIKDFELLYDIALLGNKLSLFTAKELFIDLFHNFEPYKLSRTPSLDAKIADINKQEKELRLRKLAMREDLLESAFARSSVLVNSFLTEGNFKENFSRRLETESYDLVIVNPSETADIQNFFNERNLTWLLDSTLEPVLIIPQSIKEDAFDEAVCLISNAEMYQQCMESDLMGFLKPKCIHFGSKTVDESVEVIPSANPLDSIRAYMQEHPNSLYLIKHKKENMVTALFNRSLAKSLVTNLSASLLVI